MQRALDDRPRGPDAMKVAIVGAGISGLSAAYALHRDHEVALFERESRAGGHVKTVDVDGPTGRSRSIRASSSTTSGPTRRFVALLGELGVATQPSDMSFGSACRACAIEFSSRGARRSAQPAGRSPSVALADVRRHRSASTATPARVLDARRRATPTLGDYLEDRGFGRGFRDHFLMPITSAVWSTAADRILEFPVDYLLRFLDNHGLIGYGRALQWRTSAAARGPTSTGILDALGRGAIRAGDPVVAVRASRAPASPCGRPPASASAFDAVVMATHADDALTCSATPIRRERRALGGFDYTTQPGRPPHRRARHAAPRARLGVVERRPGRLPTAGRRADDDLPHEPAPVAARARSHYFVSVNPDDRLDRRPGDRGAPDSPPAVHVPDARRAGRVGALQGHRGT